MCTCNTMYVCTCNTMYTVDIAENALCSHYKEMLQVWALTFQLALELGFL